MWFLVYLRYFYGLPADHHAASTAALQVSQPTARSDCPIPHLGELPVRASPESVHPFRSHANSARITDESIRGA